MTISITTNPTLVSVTIPPPPTVAISPPASLPVVTISPSTLLTCEITPQNPIQATITSPPLPTVSITPPPPIPAITINTTTVLAGNIIGTLSEFQGGTGQENYLPGEILYSSAVDELSRLPPGNDTDILTIVGGLPSWESPAENTINEVPSGTINGSNAVFTTAFPFIPDTIRLFVNGVRQKPGGSDYINTDNQTILLTASPVVGDELLIDYQKA